MAPIRDEKSMVVDDHTDTVNDDENLWNVTCCHRYEENPLSDDRGLNQSASSGHAFAFQYSILHTVENTSLQKDADEDMCVREP
jgi:hypothetical protein